MGVDLYKLPQEEGALAAFILNGGLTSYECRRVLRLGPVSRELSQAISEYLLEKYARERSEKAAEKAVALARCRFPDRFIYLKDPFVSLRWLYQFQQGVWTASVGLDSFQQDACNSVQCATRFPEYESNPEQDPSGHHPGSGSFEDLPDDFIKE
jgi:hypothetical protein